MPWPANLLRFGRVPDRPQARPRAASGDLCPVTLRARLSYRRAAESFELATRPLANPGATAGELQELHGWTLHQLRHSLLTHEAEDGTSTPMLFARSRHASVRGKAPVRATRSTCAPAGWDQASVLTSDNAAYRTLESRPSGNPQTALSQALSAPAGWQPPRRRRFLGASPRRWRATSGPPGPRPPGGPTKPTSGTSLLGAASKAEDSRSYG